MGTEKRGDAYLRRAADDIFPELHRANVLLLPVDLYDSGQPVNDTDINHFTK